MLTIGRGASTAPRHRRRRYALLLSGMGVAAVTGAALIDVERPSRHQRRSAVAFPAPAAWAEWAATPPAALADPPMRAVLVVSPRDCSGNLTLASMMLRGSGLSLERDLELVINASAFDTTGLRALVPRSHARSHMRLLEAHERELMLQAGLGETPLLMLYDREGRLRMATHTDADPVARRAFNRAVVHLAARLPTR